jgi:Sulfite exporter TauE/SafE
MSKQTLIICIIALTLMCATYMIYQYFQQPQDKLSITMKVKLMFTGFIAFIADSLGIGSFATTVAFSYGFRLFTIEELPAALNTAQVIPGAIESLFFINLVDFDLKVLTTLIVGTCIGGVLGGFVVSKLSQKTIRIAMILSFGTILFLLMGHGTRVLPMIDESFDFGSWKLVLGFFGMMLCGALTPVGVGLFISVQSILYLLKVSPLLAFPIMTAAGAMQQPLTAFTFLSSGKTPLNKVIIITLSGVAGVLIALPWFKNINVTWLHYVLMLMLTFNIFMLSKETFLPNYSKIIKAKPT